MARILSNIRLADRIHELTVEAPLVARKAQPGHFVLVMADEVGERIPLTVADYDRERGTINLVVMAVGTSTTKINRLPAGHELHAFVGPLGHESEIANFGTVVMVAGGVGAAPVFPIARALKHAGNRVITIHGARTKDLLFWQDKLAAVSDDYLVTTDDGSAGRKGLVTEPLHELLRDDTKKLIGRVYAIGPTVMMKFCSRTSEPFGVRTIVSLNSIMIDGTGMCGGCRVDIGGSAMFTCVDGPEFDGHLVDWDKLLHRQKVYVQHEQCSYDRYLADLMEAGR